MALESKTSTVDAHEVAKFSALAQQWWDQKGPLHTLHAINPARLSFIESYTQLHNQSLLDVGCGGGILSEALAKAGARVKGIDADEKVIACAMEHAKGQGLTLEYACMPIEKHSKAQYDSITCMELLEHVQQPELLLGHCASLLKPGGLLFLSTINRTPKAYIEAIVAAEYVLGLLPRQTHNYTLFIKPSELAALGRKLGLELLGMSGLSYNPLTREATLCKSVAVNYLMVLRSAPSEDAFLGLL